MAVGKTKNRYRLQHAAFNPNINTPANKLPSSTLGQIPSENHNTTKNCTHDQKKFAVHKPRKELPALVFQEIKKVKEREAQPKKRYRSLFSFARLDCKSNLVNLTLLLLEKRERVIGKSLQIFHPFSSISFFFWTSSKTMRANKGIYHKLYTTVKAKYHNTYLKETMPE